MKIERFAGHNEAREALMISVASVTAIMLTAYLILLILYWPLTQTAKDEWPGRLCWPDSQWRQACEPARAAIHQGRVGSQSQNR
jgi:hypothetical protein